MRFSLSLLAVASVLGLTAANDVFTDVCLLSNLELDGNILWATCQDTCFGDESPGRSSMDLNACVGNSNGNLVSLSYTKVLFPYLKRNITDLKY
jgi:hypothetical protein